MGSSCGVDAQPASNMPRLGDLDMKGGLVYIVTVPFIHSIIISTLFD